MNNQPAIEAVEAALDEGGFQPKEVVAAIASIFDASDHLQLAVLRGCTDNELAGELRRRGHIAVIVCKPEPEQNQAYGYIRGEASLTPPATPQQPPASTG